MNDLKSIIGMRSNVSALVYEHFNGMEICVGGFYYGDNQIIQIDGIRYSMNLKVAEFHWSANNLKIFIN